ncbi:MAG: phage portal protein [Methylobacterium mesophilicum]|nr:phage portal protein [Methylobacterium mesophilicum]
MKGRFGLGGERKSAPVTLIDPTAAEIFGTIPSIAGPSVGPSSALRVPAVYSAIALISGAIGSLPAKVFRAGDGGKRAAKEHASYRLVHDEANEWTSAGQLRSQLTADALLFDHGFALANRLGDGRVYEFIRLDPRNVTIKNDEASGEPVYVERVGSKDVSHHFRDVLHISAPLAMSPIKAGREAIGLSLTLERCAANLFKTGMRPSGVISIPENAVTPNGANVVGNIRKAWRNWFSENSGDPLILDGGKTYQSETMTSADAQFLEMRVEQIREIARVFRVPPHLLFELSRATWSNAEEMYQSFLTLTLRDWLDAWEWAYARVLLSQEERAGGVYVEFVVDDLLSANTSVRTEAYQKLRSMGAMTANEVRARENLPAMPGGDVLASPYTAPAVNTASPSSAPVDEKEAA